MGKVRKNKIRHTVRSMDDDMGAVPFPSETVKPSLKDVRMEKVDGKKIERRKKRRENWLKRIEMCKDRKVKEKAMEERKKTVIVGDMEPLVRSLPVLSANGSEMKKDKTTKETTRTLLKELSHYQEVLKHPAFKQDPMATITEHVQNSVTSGVI